MQHSTFFLVYSVIQTCWLPKLPCPSLFCIVPSVWRQKKYYREFFLPHKGTPKKIVLSIESKSHLVVVVVMNMKMVTILYVCPPAAPLTVASQKCSSPILYEKSCNFSRESLFIFWLGDWMFCLRNALLSNITTAEIVFF